jgi:hypothetical protein
VGVDQEYLRNAFIRPFQSDVDNTVNFSDANPKAPTEKREEEAEKEKRKAERKKEKERERQRNN